MLAQGLAAFAVHFDHADAVAPQAGDVEHDAFAARLVEEDAVAHAVGQQQLAGAGEIGVDNLQVGVVGGDGIRDNRR